MLLIEELENIWKKKVPNSLIMKNAFLVYLASSTNLLFICVLAIKIYLYWITTISEMKFTKSSIYTNLKIWKSFQN